MAVKPINYTPLEVRPIDHPSFPRFCKAARVAMTVFAGIALGAAIGVATALTFGFQPIILGSIAALVGVIAGGAFGFFDKELEPIAQYRIQTLEDLEKTQTNKKILEDTIPKLKSLFRETVPEFVQSYESHSLHDRLTLISEQMHHEHKRNGREDIKKVWQVFLDRLKGFTVKWPDKTLHPIDLSFEQARLDGKTINYKVELLKNPTDADLDQVVELEKEAFGRPGTFYPEQLRAELSKPLGFLYVARREGSSEILGFNWGRQDQERKAMRTICGIARKGAAARLGIGEKLMDQLVQDSSGRELKLQVRASNQSAISLYEKYGFVKQKIFKNYYPEPTEDALLMERPSIGKLAKAS